MSGYSHFIYTNEDLSKFSLSAVEIERLINVNHALSIPHTAQQLLSFEKTPTLSFYCQYTKISFKSGRNFKKTYPNSSSRCPQGSPRLRITSGKQEQATSILWQ